MKNILISGAPGTGKTLIATSTSYMTGLPMVSNRTSSEVIYEFNLSTDLTNQSFKDLFTIGFANFTDRIDLEQRYSEGFISDSSVLNDLIILKLYLKEQSLINKSFFKWITNSRYLNQCQKMVSSLERLVKDYFNYQNYDVIHLSPAQNNGFNINHLTPSYIDEFNKELISFYKDYNIMYTEYPYEEQERLLIQIVKDKKIKPKISVSNALFKAYSDMHIGTLSHFNNDTQFI